jgi:hypothetical protein
MPELTVHRKNAALAPMICMYCGDPATSTEEWREENHKPVRGGGGTDITPVPTGDDPVSAVTAVLMLPLILWQLLVALVAGIGAVAGWANRPAALYPAPVAPPKPAPTMLVVVTTCERHRHYHRRYWWAWMATVVVLAALWTWAIVETRKVMGTEDVDFAVALVVTAIFATVLLPLGVGALRFLHGPVIVDRVTEGTVVLDRVRQAYFDATGLKPVDQRAEAA